MSTPKKPIEMMNTVKEAKRHLKERMNKYGLKSLTTFYPKKELIAFNVEQRLKWDTNQFLTHAAENESSLSEDVEWLEKFLEYVITRHRMEKMDYGFELNYLKKEIKLQQYVYEVGSRKMDEKEWVEKMIRLAEGLGQEEFLVEIKINTLFEKTKEKADFEFVNFCLDKEFQERSQRVERWMRKEIFEAIEETEKRWGNYCYRKYNADKLNKR